MGMRVRITLYAPDEHAARAAASAAFSTIAALENTFSDYRARSELSRVAARAGEWTPVSEPLFEVVKVALDVARASDGAYDPTVAPLVALWRAARASGTLPDDAAWDAARSHVGWQRVQLDPARRALRLERGMRLDLGGIAKGYILQRALAAVRERGIAAALIEAGGDVVVGEPPPGRTGWVIDVPGADASFAAAAASLAHAALATSGSRYQFIEVDGVRHSHVIDPRTGRPVTAQWTAHVMAGDAALADALATALSVLGPAGIMRLQRQYPIVRLTVGRPSGEPVRASLSAPVPAVRGPPQSS